MSAPRAPFPGSIQYTVKGGDSLYRISQRHGISICGLKLVNGLTSNMIYEGLVLNLPGETSVVFRRHAVRAGDELRYTALKHGVQLAALVDENELACDLLRSGVLAEGRELWMPAIQQWPLQEIVVEKGVSCCHTMPGIVVDKSQHTLMLFVNGIWLKTYQVELGSGGAGDSELPGDRRTPEGTYYIPLTSEAASGARLPNPCGPRPGSGELPRYRSAADGESQSVGAGGAAQPSGPGSGSISLSLSYPNTKDAYRGLQRGLIDWDTYDSIAAAINNGEMPPQDTALGGGIGIHGGGRPDLGSDWTRGSIALTDHDMEEVYSFVRVTGTAEAQVQCHVFSTRASSALP